MTRTVKISPRAQLQIEQVDQWWRAHREGAPDLFINELAACLELIARSPGSGISFNSNTMRGTRRLLLTKTRYHVYYLPGDTEALVLAVWHAQRGSRPRLK